MKTTMIRAALFALVALFAVSACSKKEPPTVESEPPPSATSTPEAPVVFDPKMPSFKCGAIRCNVDYYCVERSRQTPSELCTSHPPSAKRQGCTKVAPRSFTCETFP